jgi:hypothetical protein
MKQYRTTHPMAAPALTVRRDHLDSIPGAATPTYLHTLSDPPESLEIPAELFLRQLLALDPSSPEEILQFANQYGVIDLTPLGTPAIEGLGLLRKWYKHPPDQPFPVTPLIDHYGPEGDRRRETFGDLAALRLVEAESQSVDDPPGSHRHLHALLEVSAKTMQSLVNQWLGLFEAASPASAWTWLSETPGPGNEECLSIFEGLMNWLLEPFAPRVEVATPTTQGSPPALAAVIARQLFNAIEEGRPPKTCPRCGTRFIRHEGRDQHGQNRLEGVKFCSRKCGKAATEKARRDRLREQKASTKGLKAAPMSPSSKYPQAKGEPL